MKLKKYIAHWYDMTEVKYTDPEPIKAPTEEEATNIAYSRFNGNPPAPVLYLELVVYEE